jgi:hypothetical protein
MKYLLTIVVAAILATVASPALAHRPYYTQIEKIRLPNAELGEVRLLKGDGIFFTDPVRPIVIDEQGHLIARGPKALSMTVSCGEDHRCVIVNLWDAHTLELDSASFRQGAVQPTIQRGDRTDDWELEGGNESWGFSTREATSAEMWTANMVLAREALNGLILTAFLGALGAVFVVPVRLDISSKRRRFLTRAGLILIGSLILCFFVAVSLWMALLGGLTFELWIVSLATGACVTWMIAALVKTRSRRQAIESASV